jgi:hypothetical protein
MYLIQDILLMNEAGHGSCAFSDVNGVPSPPKVGNSNRDIIIDPPPRPVIRLRNPVTATADVGPP